MNVLCTRAQWAAGSDPSQQGCDWWLSDETLQVGLEAAAGGGGLQLLKRTALS